MKRIAQDERRGDGCAATSDDNETPRVVSPGRSLPDVQNASAPHEPRHDAGHEGLCVSCLVHAGTDSPEVKPSAFAEHVNQVAAPAVRPEARVSPIYGEREWRLARGVRRGHALQNRSFALKPHGCGDRPDGTGRYPTRGQCSLRSRERDSSRKPSRRPCLPPTPRPGTSPTRRIQILSVPAERHVVDAKTSTATAGRRKRRLRQQQAPPTHHGARNRVSRCGYQPRC